MSGVAGDEQIFSGSKDILDTVIFFKIVKMKSN